MKKDEAYILRRVNINLDTPLDSKKAFISYVGSDLKNISPKNLAAYFALLSNEDLDKDFEKSPLHVDGNHDSRIDLLRSMIKEGVDTFKLALYLNEFDSDFLTSVEDILNINSLDLAKEFKTFSSEDRALYEKYCCDRKDSNLDKSSIFPLSDKSENISLSRRLVEFSPDQLKGIWDCVRDEDHLWNFEVESWLSYRVFSTYQKDGDSISDNMDESIDLNNLLIKYLVIDKVAKNHDSVKSFSESLNKSLESTEKQTEMEKLFIVDGVKDQSALDSLRSLLDRKANYGSSKQAFSFKIFPDSPNREKYYNIEGFIDSLGSTKKGPDRKSVV